MSYLDSTKIISKDLLNDTNDDEYIKKKSQFSNVSYELIQYNKKTLDKENYVDKGLVRSLIFNLNNNKLVCYSPPKSLLLSQFVNNLTNEIILEEFVEGTMINLFYDNEEWNIATKGSIGGKCKFYQNEDQPTFHEMFFDICKEVNLDLNMLPHNYCYSFVMQNRKNRIVKQIMQNNLYFITAYEINNDDTIKVDNLYKSKDKFEELKNIFINNSNVKFPVVYDTINKEVFDENFEKYKDIYASRNTKYDKMGVIFKNVDTGEHAKLRNPIHKEIHDLKGNHCKIQYIYLDLRKCNKISRYLKYYPEDKLVFLYLRNMVHEYTKNLYRNYVNCYIKKQKPLKEWPFEFRIHMYNLHQYFLTELKEKNKYIDLNQVIQYFNNLHPSQQMYALNYNLRQNNVDKMKIELEEQNEKVEC
jgi:hypothetical protein